MREHQHNFGDAVATDPIYQGDEGDQRAFYIYASECPCGAVEVSTRDRVLIIVSAQEVNRTAETR